MVFASHVTEAKNSPKLGMYSPCLLTHLTALPLRFQYFNYILVRNSKFPFWDIVKRNRTLTVHKDSSLETETPSLTLVFYYIIIVCHLHSLLQISMNKFIKMSLADGNIIPNVNIPLQNLILVELLVCLCHAFVNMKNGLIKQ